MKIRFPFRLVKTLPLLACLSGAPALAQISVTVNAGTAVVTIPNAIYGNNAQFYNAHNNGSDTTYNSALSISGCRNIRWPGGSEADQTNWNNVVCWDGGAATTPQFVSLLQGIGGNLQPIVNASGIWCNGGSGSAAPTTFTYAAAVSLAEAWVTWNKSNGGSAKATYWEVGNEIYGNWEVGGQGTANVNMSGTVYGQNFANFYNGMKAIDSTIKIGAVASPGSGDYTNWTPNMLTAAKAAGVVPDFLIVHNYPVSQGAPAGSATDKYLLSFPATVATQTSSLNGIVSAALGSSYVGQVKYFMTEFNCCLGPDAQVNEYVNAMFCAEWLMECAKNGWIGANLWATENGGPPDYGFLNTTTDVPYPNYYVYPMLTGKFGTNMVSCTSSNATTLSSYAALDGSGDLTLFAVNNNPTASQSVTFNISGFTPSTTGKAWVMLPVGTGSSGVSQEATTISINGNNNPAPGNVSGIAGTSQATSSTFTVTLQPSEMYLLVIPASTTSNPTSTFTPTATRTFTLTPTNTFSATRTATATASSTATMTRTNTLANTSTNTPTNSFTATRTNTPTLTPTSTSTATATATRTNTLANTTTNTTTSTASATPSSTPSRTATPTTTNTPANTPTLTRTNTATSTATLTATNSPTATRTNTPVNTSTASNTPTNTSSNSPTSTATATRTSTLANTPTASMTPTLTATATYTNSATSSPTSTSTATRTSTPVNTSTNTPALTPTDSITPTASLTASATPSHTATSTASATPSPSSTATRTDTPSATFTPTNTDTPTITFTPTNTQTGTQPPTNTTTNTATVTDSFTATHTATTTDTSTATLTATDTATSTATLTATHTMTDTATATATSTATNTSVNTSTATPTATNTLVNTATATSTTTNTASSTATSTASSTTTRTATPSATSTSTGTPTATVTDTATITPTPTNTSTGTQPPTATPTNTATMTPTNSATASTTPTPSSSMTATPSLTVTSTQTSTGTSTATRTYTPIPTGTFTASLTPTFTPSFTTTVTPSVTFTPNSSLPTPNSTQVVIGPNPATGTSVNVYVPSTAPAQVRIEIFTVAFRKVLDETFYNVQPGTPIPLELKDQQGTALADGIYYVVVTADGHRYVVKLLVIH